jgi:uncharacterized protein (DUF2336 family)
VELVQSTDEMLALARSKSPADRERLLLTVADLCQDAEDLTDQSQALVRDIFLDLVVQAERDIRLRLSEKLADAAWAPHAVVGVLALDEIEIARPLIANSPVLQDADLLRLLVEATLEHQIEVARRPCIGPPVVSAILDQGQPAVLAALADNATALVTPQHMQRLVMASRRIAAMRGPLARHPQLTDNLAHMLYGWVGESLRAGIGERFAIDPDKLADTVSEAVAEAVAGDGRAARSAAEGGQERDEMERRLVEKLQAAGQLRPSYLLRALREGRSTLFENALATLGGYRADAVRQAIDANRPELVALACAGVGIDRSVFPTILSLLQAANRGRPVAGAQASPRIAAAFSQPLEQAAEAFRRETPAI